MGSLEILNVQAGDTKITYDTSDAAEAIRAKRIITDMLRRGYALLVEVETKKGKEYQRIKRFDARVGEYIIADFDGKIAEQADAREGEKPAGKRAVKTRRLPMHKTRAAAIAPRVGG